MKNLKVVIGAGPVGWTVAEQLAAQGSAVRLLTRSGSGPVHPLITRERVDASDAASLDRALEGADAVFDCIHASAYAEEAWKRELPRAESIVLQAAHDAGAVVVFPESLYSYSDPDSLMTETSARDVRTGKRGVRTQLLAARSAAAAATVSVVASDFFGPRVRIAHAGERMVPAVLAGKAIQVIGSPDQPHSFTYVPDLAAAMIRAAVTPKLWNSVLHAPTLPPLTQRELILATAAAAGVTPPKVTGTPGWALSALGRFNSGIREIAELSYQFERPFVMSSTATEEQLGMAPTPLDEALIATLAWWRTDPAVAHPGTAA